MDTFDYTEIVSAPVILYGAGKQAQAGLDFLREKGAGNIVCLCDADPAKRRGGWPAAADVRDLPVLSPEKAIGQYPDAYVYVTPLMPIRREICADMKRSKLFRAERIINREPTEKVAGCWFLDNFAIIMDYVVSCCCKISLGLRNKSPKVPYYETISETMEHVAQSRIAIFDDLRSNGNASTCAGCPEVRDDYWRSDGKITTLSFALKTPCQLSCRYCHTDNHLDYPAHMIRHFTLLPLLKEILADRHVAPEACIQLVSGEITIDPQREAIYAAVGNHPVIVASNGVRYDEAMAELLSRPGNYLQISLDAGGKHTGASKRLMRSTTW